MKPHVSCSLGVELGSEKWSEADWLAITFDHRDAGCRLRGSGAKVTSMPLIGTRGNSKISSFGRLLRSEVMVGAEKLPQELSPW